MFVNQHSDITGKMDACVCSKHLYKLTRIFVCQIFGLGPPGVHNTVSVFLDVCIGYVLIKLDAKYYYKATSYKSFINQVYVLVGQSSYTETVSKDLKSEGTYYQQYH